MLFRRPSGVYNFRRSVPPAIRTEIGRTEFVATLGTSSPTLARARAGRLYDATETMFRAARTMSMAQRTDEQDAIDFAEGAITTALATVDAQRKIIEAERQRYELEAATIRL